jgi:hypothetical protein
MNDTSIPQQTKKPYEDHVLPNNTPRTVIARLHSCNTLHLLWRYCIEQIGQGINLHPSEPSHCDFMKTI